MIDSVAREISTEAAPPLAYSICTIVTRHAEYEDLLNNFQEHGFTLNDCEFLYVDNGEHNRLDAFSAYNKFLLTARGEYVLLCHQDVLLLEDGRTKLDLLLGELTLANPAWALCGNAGAKEDGSLVFRISDPFASDEARGGPFPAKVMSLDENFIVARRHRNLALSHDLSGFHWYGADLCLIASLLGSQSYVIDFHLRHKSAGSMDDAFLHSRNAFATKYSKLFRPHWHHVPSQWPVYLCPSFAKSMLPRLAWEFTKRTRRDVVR